MKNTLQLLALLTVTFPLYGAENAAQGRNNLQGELYKSYTRAQYNDIIDQIPGRRLPMGVGVLIVQDRAAVPGVPTSYIFIPTTQGTHTLDRRQFIKYVQNPRCLLEELRHNGQSPMYRAVKAIHENGLNE